VLTKAVPALNGAAARTITYNYTLGGDSMTTTVLTVVDLADVGVVRDAGDLRVERPRRLVAGGAFV
jgi:hypothetical protein